MQNNSIYFILLVVFTNALNAAGLEERTITIRSNERFDLVKEGSVQFKFQPLSDEARALDISKGASALGVAYLGQVTLKENITPLDALRAIADQISTSLGISFGVVADSNSSLALKKDEMLLLYHPQVTLNLMLIKPDAENPYEMICSYVVRESEAQPSTQ